MREYEAMLPGAAGRLFTLLESQQAHRHGLEGKVVTAGILRDRLGQVMAFLLGAMLIGGGVFLLYHDKRLEGFSAIATAIGSLGGAFLVARWRQVRDLAEKRAGDILKERESARMPSGRR